MTLLDADVAKPTKNRMFFIFAGLLYGFAMFIWAFFALGMGDGSPVVSFIFSSPATLLVLLFESNRSVYTAFLMIPLIWIIFGLLVAFIDYAAARIAFLVFIIAHYIMIEIVLKKAYAAGNLFYKLDNVDGFSILIIGLAAYLAGQIVMWRRFKKFYKNSAR